jgi:hypothetical protein
VFVADISNDQATNGTHQKGGSKNNKGLNQISVLFVFVRGRWKEDLGNHVTEKSKEGEIIPFENVSHYAHHRV